MSATVSDGLDVSLIDSGHDALSNGGRDEAAKGDDEDGCAHLD